MGYDNLFVADLSWFIHNAVKVYTNADFRISINNHHIWIKNYSENFLLTIYYVRYRVICCEKFSNKIQCNLQKWHRVLYACFLTLDSGIDVPRQLIFQKFSTQGILIPTPQQLDLKKNQSQNVLCHQCFLCQRKKDFLNLLIHPIHSFFCQETILCFCLCLKKTFSGSLLLWCFHQINRFHDAFLKKGWRVKLFFL